MIRFERRHNIKRLGPIIDKINIVLSVCVILSGIILVADIRKYIFMFPVLFTFAALVNLLLAFKCYKMAEMARSLILAIAFVALTVLSVIGYIVTLT